MHPITQTAAAFVANLRFTELPPGAAETVATGFSDCIGVMLAARQDPAVRILCEELVEAGSGRSAILLGRQRARASDAALINGTAAHAFDYDDIGLGAHPAHPSAVLVPAILAQADHSGATGQEMIAAYVAGYEVWGEVALRDAGQHVARGWHPTGVFGPLAAAAATASLLKLDVDASRSALAIAASRSAGLLSNYGSMTKPMHAGLAAQAGVFAARLAARGFTGGPAALEHERGLIQAVSPDGNFDVDTPSALGERWNIISLPLGFKRYPVCYAMHRAIDVAIELRDRIPAGALGDIERIDVRIGTDQAKLLHIHSPNDSRQAKFSLEFGVAAALLSGRVGLEQLDDAYVQSVPVQSLMRKVRFETTEERDPVYRIFSPSDDVRISLVSGATLEGSCRVALGHPDRPLAEEHHRMKFLDSAGPAFAAGDAEAAFHALMNLRDLPSTAALPCTLP